MLTPHDELLCHQLTTTFDHVAQSDLRWTERVVLYGFDRKANLSLMTGMARYANRNVTDAYAMITRGDEEAHVVRLSRETDAAVDGLASWAVGGYTYEVIEPLWKVRATLTGREYDINLDVTLTGRFPAYEQTPAFHRSRGRVQEDARRYYQNGTVTGWLDFDGRRVELNPDAWWFGRDHSWGTRHGGGGGSLPEGNGLQPPEVPEGVLYMMGIFEFEDELIHFAQREDSHGMVWQFEGEILPAAWQDRVHRRIARVEHELKFFEGIGGTRLIHSGEFAIHCADGTSDKITVRPMRDFWPGFAGYDQFRGYASGMWRGAEWHDQFTVCLREPQQMRQVSMLSESFVEVRMGDRIGHGLIESVFLGAYPRYGYHGW